MGRLSIPKKILIWTGTLGLAAVGGSGVWTDACKAQQAAGGRGSVYQRRAFESSPVSGGWNDSGESEYGSASAPQINAGWFQRPYPYHLDYYRMRYGGSYAPYFGNLYGPPKVVTAPPYYGPYYNGGGYGGFGYNGFGNDGPAGYGYPAANGQSPFWCPCDPNVRGDETKMEEQKNGRTVER